MGVPTGECSMCHRKIYFGSGSGQDVAFICLNCGFSYCPKCSNVSGFWVASGKCPRCGGKCEQKKD